jgi:hypothetical protein
MAHNKIQRLVGLKTRLMAIERNITEFSAKRENLVAEIQEVLSDGAPSADEIAKEKSRLQTLIDSLTSLEAEGQ